jgi:hypothetical protein
MDVQKNGRKANHFSRVVQQVRAIHQIIQKIINAPRIKHFYPVLLIVFSKAGVI